MKLNTTDNQRTIAKKAQVSESMISHIYKGKRMPSIKLAKKLQQLYNVSLDDIYTKENK
jgi:DNA-binding XRE family transcriptional regulator